MTNKTRADFEAWFLKEYNNADDFKRFADDGMYLDPSVNADWDVWQAATIKATPQHAETETVAWLIEWGKGSERRKRIFSHNEIGDYRALFDDATVHELVRRLPPAPGGEV
jgi:hypothetical protein